MALSESQKKRILDMLEELNDEQQAAIIESESSLWTWLRQAASWLWDKFSNAIIDGLIKSILDWF